MNEKIIIVEDDESIRRLVEVTLKSHGYNPLGFDNAEDALAEMSKEAPAIAIFDIMMAGVDGLEAVRRIRQIERLRAVPIIMLTAKDRELDKIIGLDSGADDYMTKPFSVLELCARVRAQLRRTASDEKCVAVIYESNDLCINIAAHEVTVADVPVLLTLKEFELLKLLIENRNRALSRMEILAQVWGEDYCGETRTLDIHIGTLRQKLGDTAENSRYIKTIRGVGYRFIGGDKE
ncbi:MAG: response regulator transcription factor [Methanomicrobiales archaeon]|jgi:two-component system alkaline phosphatase synthesis response regulator PhoP|nr:response regulator transcription factor [Methanomicrobiales archaeon]